MPRIITPAQAVKAKAMLDKGLSLRKVAAKANLSLGTVQRIAAGEHWSSPEKPKKKPKATRKPQVKPKPKAKPKTLPKATPVAVAPPDEGEVAGPTMMATQQALFPEVTDVPAGAGAVADPAPVVDAPAKTSDGSDDDVTDAEFSEGTSE
jgi:hypothetical protein